MSPTSRAPRRAAVAAPKRLVGLAALVALVSTAPAPAWARARHGRRGRAHRARDVAGSPPASRAPSARPDTRGPTRPGVIRAVRRELVYVSLGLDSGARVGQRLHPLDASGRPLPGVELEVLHVSARTLVARARGGHAGTSRLRPGVPVQAPGPGAPAAASAPVKRLPTPSATVPASAWAAVARRGRATVPFRGPHTGLLRARAARHRGLSGDLTFTYAGVVASGGRPQDVHSLRLRSRLQVQRGAWDWAHDVTGRLDLGPRLSQRQGADSRPYYELRRARVRYRSPSARATTQGEGGWGVGAWSLSLGRLWLSGAGNPGLVDGVSTRVGLGRGLALGLHGGAAPALLDAGLSSDLVTGGVDVGGAWSARGWRGAGRASAEGSLWRGQTNRVDVTLGGSLARGGDLYVASRVTATAVPGAASAVAGPTAALSHAYVGGSVRPLGWLHVHAHFSHDRELVDRELAARVGPLGVVAGPRDTAWLQTTLDAGRHVSLQLGGSLGFGAAESELYGGLGRVVLQGLTALDLRVAAAYRISQGPVVRGQVASVDASVLAGRGWHVGVGYAFTTFRSRMLDAREDEHAVEGRLSWLSRGPWRLDLTGAWAGGDRPARVRLFALMGWRFP